MNEHTILLFALGFVIGCVLTLVVLGVLHRHGKSVPGVRPPIPTLKGRWVFDGSHHVYVIDP